VPGPLILVDSHEGKSVVRALLALEARVTVRSLPVGDYLVATGVLVERKTVRDLHLSIVDGRFGVSSAGSAVPVDAGIS
jgi:DNA excision repair protein ERCC-4